MISEKECKCEIKINNLSVKVNNEYIINNINLDVHHSEILALIGKNGAGKTTLLKAIMNRIPYTGNIVFINSKGGKIKRPKIGYVPQRLIFDKSTPVTVLDLFSINMGRLPVWLGCTDKTKSKAREMLMKVGASEHINKSLGSLSGGELQRVLLAFALYPVPDILLLDEPVSAVDRKGINTFYDIILSMRQEYHMPIILVSHDLGHVKKYANNVVLMDKTIIATGTSDNFMKDKRFLQTFGLEEGDL